MAHFASIATGRKKVSGGTHYIRHRHAAPYAAIVLRGGYEEAGECGRVRVCAGDIVLHDAFDAHCDRFDQGVSEILNLPLPLCSVPSTVIARIDDVDAFVRIAERDAREAAAVLFQLLKPVDAHQSGWQDKLAADLWCHPGLCLSYWASAHGLAPETISRGFERLYGVSPARFRADVRARRAWNMLRVGLAPPLAEIAHRAGFADQPHFTREILRLTGQTPGAWCRSNPFKTAAAG